MYRDERVSDSHKIERTGAGTDPVRVTCPENSRGKKLIGFGNLFGIHDNYEGDEVRIQGGGDHAESSGSVEVTVKD